MNHRSLLVLLDNEPACTLRTRFAVELARSQGYHLIGLAPTGVIDMTSTMGSATALAETTERAWEALHDQAARVIRAFDAECSAAGVESFETLVDPTDPTGSLIRHAHAADLVVLSQPGGLDAGRRRAPNLVDEVVLKCARPTLVVPRSGRLDSVATRVLVAWDDSREAARALSDAVPILRHARQVELMLCRVPGVADDAALHARLDAVQRWLERRGITSEVRVEPTTGAVARALHLRALTTEADLIVMGAYGHARWIERVLGGTTRSTLATLDVPVLMSH